MEKKFSAPRGTADILPLDSPAWQELEACARNVLRLYGYQEMRTPIFEETSLFARSLGQTSDVVQKQMLNLAKNRADEDAQSQDGGLSLRPEGTASIVRSYIENDLAKQEALSKIFYIGPMFRGERPQKGRLRQFHQIGVEAIGPDTSIPYLDAEIIALSAHLLTAFGLSGYKIRINSLGSPEDKKNFSSVLREKLRPNLSKLCEDCQSRFERNVFRILDCKNKECRKIVQSLELGESHLSEASREYFAKVRDALKILEVPFEVSPQLVRGLDYYTHTVFEISHESLGSQDAVGAGGRYNGLVAELGGDPKGNIGAMGFALGMERILLARAGREKVPGSRADAFIVALDREGEQLAYLAAFKLLKELRQAQIAADLQFSQSSMKSQMRLADRLGARYVIMLGENELKSGSVTLKDMSNSQQSSHPLSGVARLLKEKLQNS